MAIEFFMLPDEQSKWLERTFVSDDSWCWIRRRDADSRLISGPFKTGDLRFDSEKLVELDFGRSSVQTPLFRETPFCTEIDFPRSLAVQFLPSLILKGHMLTVGQLGITSKGWYEYLGIQAQSVVKWYQQLARLLKKTFLREYMAIVKLDDGRVYTYRDIHLSPGAVEWWRKGNELRTPTNDNIRFDVVPREEIK